MNKGTSNQIRKARIAVNQKEEVLAQELGISISHYEDLEAYDEELESTLSLKQVYKLASLLNLKVEELPLLTETPFLTTNEVSSRILNHAKSTKTTINLLGESIGWEIEEITQHPAKLMEQPLIFFADVARTLGVSMEKVVPRKNDT